MASDLSSRFVEYLRQGKHLTTHDGRVDAAGQDGADRRQVKLWELADLSASEFADEAARFHGLERVSLQDMIAASPLVGSFSQRFLREMVVFPYQSSDGSATLAIADPTDMAAQRGESERRSLKSILCDERCRRFERALWRRIMAFVSG